MAKSKTGALIAEWLGRVCSAEVPIPYARHMEQAALPQVDGIVAEARRLVGR